MHGKRQHPQRTKNGQWCEPKCSIQILHVSIFLTEIWTMLQNTREGERDTGKPYTPAIATKLSGSTAWPDSSMKTWEKCPRGKSAETNLAEREREKNGESAWTFRFPLGVALCRSGVENEERESSKDSRALCQAVAKYRAKPNLPPPPPQSPNQPQWSRLAWEKVTWPRSSSDFHN